MQESGEHHDCVDLKRQYSIENCTDIQKYKPLYERSVTNTAASH